MDPVTATMHPFRLHDGPAGPDFDPFYNPTYELGNRLYTQMYIETLIGIEFDDRFGEHVVTHAEAMRVVGNIGQGLWAIIHFSQCRDVDWLSDQDDRPLVHTPRNLAQFLAVCARRFGSAQPQYAMCEQCRNGDGIFQTCVREVSMRELAFSGRLHVVRRAGRSPGMSIC